MDKINLQVTIDEANIILAALGQLPYLKVADLIRTIQAQGAAQLQQEGAVPAQGTSIIVNETAIKHGN